MKTEASRKIAIVLFNLGGPDSREAIFPFLKNFFTDPAIIGLPMPFRGWLASFIAWKRSRRQAGDGYARLGNRSPLLANTQAQAVALQKSLDEEGTCAVRVFVSMRYWHPLADEVVNAVAEFDPDQVVLLPLYPQYSTTTTGSSFADWARACRIAGFVKPTVFVEGYPTDPGFVSASVDRVRTAYEDVRTQYPDLKRPRVLFSAHGLPEKIIARGDPYQAQCEESAAAIVNALGIENLDWALCYQSRIGPMKWIGPSTAEALKQAAADQVPVVIYPHAFVSEHVETLVEIDVEYRRLAQSLGVPAFARAGTVMDHPDFIAGLSRMIMEKGDALTRSCEAGRKIPS